MDDDASSFVLPSAPSKTPEAEHVPWHGPGRGKTNVFAESAGIGLAGHGNSTTHAQIQPGTQKETRSTDFVEGTRVGVYAVKNEHFEYVSPQFVRIFGYDTHELTTVAGLTGLAIPAERPEVAQHLKDCLDGKTPYVHCTFTAPRKDGARLKIETLCSVAEVGEQRMLIGAVLDVTDQARTQTETLRLLEENRRLSRRLLSAHEEERRRLARTLHNEIAQYLTAMRSEIQRISILHADARPPVRESTRILAALCSRVQDLTHQILHGLAPPTLLNEAGLAEALNELVRSFRQHHGDVRFYLALNRLPEDVDTGVAAVAYRVIQEAMTNAVRHAAATRILVGVRGNLSAGTGGLQIVVRDNGRGFDPASVTDAGGLAGMHEFVHACDGEVSIRSRPGSGTRVEANLPVTVSDG